MAWHGTVERQSAKELVYYDVMVPSNFTLKSTFRSILRNAARYRALVGVVDNAVIVYNQSKELK